MDRRSWVLGLLLVTILPSPTHAASLRDEFDGAFRRAGFLSFAGPVVSVLASDAADFPATSTAPTFSYRFNAEAGAFERIPGSLGPVYTERAVTLGRGKYELGFGYAYLNFAKLDGTDLEDAFTSRTIGLRTDRLDLTSHVFTFSATYGLADNLDVNLLLPLFFTTLDLRVINTGSRRTGVAESAAFGVGDILLRAKYRFGDLLGAGLAAGLVLRLPSGNEDDFQGHGSTTATPSLIVSRSWGPLEAHTSLGVEADTDPVEASRARYELGAVFNVVEDLAIFADVVGNSKFTSRTETVTTAGQAFPEEFPRADIVDGIVGLKVQVGRRGLGYLAMRGPLTTDGLRADVIPSAGFEIAF